MTTDPFSTVMGERRGWQDPRATSAPRHAEVPTDPARDTDTPGRREPGVSSSGLPFRGVSQADAIAAVKACAAQLGHAPSVSDYERWRFQQTNSTPNVQLVSAPAMTTILRRLGSWRSAIRAANL